MVIKRTTGTMYISYRKYLTEVLRAFVKNTRFKIFFDIIDIFRYISIRANTNKLAGIRCNLSRDLSYYFFHIDI